MAEDNVRVRLDEDRTRYVLTVDAQVAGVASYQAHGDSWVFTHTVVDDRYEGQGLGSQLVRAALDDARARGKRVVPVCPFVAAYVRRHHDWDDMLQKPTKRLLADLAD